MNDEQFPPGWWIVPLFGVSMVICAGAMWFFVLALAGVFGY